LSLARVTLDFDGSVLGTGRYAEGTAVGFNKLRSIGVRALSEHWFGKGKALYRALTPKVSKVPLKHGSEFKKVAIYGNKNWQEIVAKMAHGLLQAR
jgi:hypothetical protein